MRVWIAIVLVGLLAACGGSDGGDGAGDAVKRQFDYIDKGQWAKMYDVLHPAHQAVVDRDLYMDCMGELTVTVSDVKIVGVEPEQSNIVEIGDIESSAVTVSVTINGIEDTDTFHEVSTDDGWRWVLQDDVLESYADGECP